MAAVVIAIIIIYFLYRHIFRPVLKAIQADTPSINQTGKPSINQSNKQGINQKPDHETNKSNNYYDNLSNTTEPGVCQKITKGREVYCYKKLADDSSNKEGKSSAIKQITKRNAQQSPTKDEANKSNLKGEVSQLQAVKARLDLEEQKLEQARKELKERERELEKREADLSKQKTTNRDPVRAETPVRNSNPSMNTGIPEIDGPGMYQRLTGCGPNGHVVYLMYSKQHNAYKVGHCPPTYLGTRLKQIRATVPDVSLAGTAVFTSRQNAFDAEQGVLQSNRSFKYTGISGSQAGNTEWLTRKPPQRRPRFTSPEIVEQRFKEESEAPLGEINVPDKYTVYLVHSKIKNAYIAKWCSSDRLNSKLRKLREEAPDAEILSRFKVHDHHMARAIAVDFNQRDNSFIREGRRDIFKWTENPSYLKEFRSWDRDGNKVLNRN